jgi:hypothetical protein
MLSLLYPRELTKPFVGSDQGAAGRGPRSAGGVDHTWGSGHLRWDRRHALGHVAAPLRVRILVEELYESLS